MEDLPAPDDPRPRGSTFTLQPSSGETIEVRDDAYSDRLRCDHPDTRDGLALGRALLGAARARGRGRVVVLAPAHLRPGLEAAQFWHEATMPGFYLGAEDCAVLGHAPEPGRATPADAEAASEVDRLVRSKGVSGDKLAEPTFRGTTRDAALIARLLAETFDHYPTPSGAPGYIESQIRQGIPFRVVRDKGEVVACASADLVPLARTAELTDCATRPSHRGRGYMQAILGDLMNDLRDLDYPTAFTLARASIPGVNLAFQRLGFGLRGRMTRSCRIGRGLEDMNVWSRSLDAA